MKTRLLVSGLMAAGIAVVAFHTIKHGRLPIAERKTEEADSARDGWVLRPGLPEQFLLDAQFLNEHQGWAVSRNNVWKTEDGGRNWEEVRRAPMVRILGERQADMVQMRLLSNAEAWVLEDYYLIHTTDGGVSWTEDPVGRRLVVRSAYFADSAHGWAVGQEFVPDWKQKVERSHPAIYGTEDGGSSWRRLFFGPEDHYPLWDVWAGSSASVWAAGVFVLHSTDAGKTWSEREISDWTGVSGMPRKVGFADQSTGWMLTNAAGGYLVTHDGGETWQPRPGLGGMANFDDMTYVDASEAWAVSGAVYHSTDDGLTWSKSLDGDYSVIRYLKDERLLIVAGRGIAMLRL